MVQISRALSLLLSAIQKRHKDVARALLAAGADPNKPEGAGVNAPYPLRAAVRINDPEMVGDLFRMGAEVDFTSRDLCDLVNHAAQYPAVLRTIVE